MSNGLSPEEVEALRQMQEEASSLEARGGGGYLVDTASCCG